MADEEFFHLDFAPRASNVVGSLVRGRVGRAFGWSEYDSGSAFSANVTYSFALPVLGSGALLRVGPSVRLDQENGMDQGLKFVYGRWIPIEWAAFSRSPTTIRSTRNTCFWANYRTSPAA